ncbi:DUF4344 domain-containing metallopeptidase [Photobacterium lucens]|uniref:DUF4344 domain-containing metallopeptidase n=1 Tax=Photobacterium lucens TaxID=2562949 RepID=UPI00136A12AA|nr:DUF4344 domain-containing metallopeptidase [Photobacterium lucens]MBP2698746.1 hypothetical protein [Vibrio parahaemolyticus]MZG56710.1 hypothetical protein [Photobacterium lucens]MZG81704.1 hypothetical protein [Photobacterium lucens]
MYSSLLTTKYKPQLGIYILVLMISFLFYSTISQAGTTKNIGTNLPIDDQYGLVLEPTPTVNFRFLPSNTAMRQTEQFIEQSPVLETIKQLSQKRFVFSPALNIVFGSDDGPLFDPITNSIHIPYQFVNESRQLFKNKGLFKTQREVNQATEDSLLHTLLHEIGHAYIADRAIPILGKEEDSVDNFATILLLNDIPRGDDIAINSADLFALEDLDTDSFDDADFVSEHSLDLQRYYNILCLVYGSNPNRYQRIFDELSASERKQQKLRCPEYFAVINQGWLHYLAE